MKKWLFLFFIFDLVFVGIVLYLTQKPSRQLATETDPYYQTLDEGQKVKWDLVKTFILVTDPEKVVVRSDLIPTLCENHQMISLKFTALNVAYAGSSPSVTSEYSCLKRRGQVDAFELITPSRMFSDLAKIETHSLTEGDTRFTSHQLLSDEEVPTQWRLSEISATGENAFSISTAELDRVHADKRFYFELK